MMGGESIGDIAFMQRLSGRNLAKICIWLRSNNMGVAMGEGYFEDVVGVGYMCV